MEQWSIRPVRHQDYQDWLQLWESYNIFYERTGPAAIPLEVTRATWARFFDPGEPMEALVAESDGTLIGLAHFLFHRSTIQVEPSCYLQDLFTAQAARGLGVGRALIEATYRAAKEVGCQRVYWQTHETNASAMLLYDKVAEKSGFIVYRKLLL